MIDSKEITGNTCTVEVDRPETKKAQIMRLILAVYSQVGTTVIHSLLFLIGEREIPIQPDVPTKINEIATQNSVSMKIILCDGFVFVDDQTNQISIGGAPLEGQVESEILIDFCLRNTVSLLNAVSHVFTVRN